MGLEVLPPDINESRSQFTVVQSFEDDKLRAELVLSPVEGSSENLSKLAADSSQLEGVVGGAAIRFGLTAIKGVGESSIRQIIDEREAHGRFTSIEDFAHRVPGKLLNKKLIESMAKAGALDSLGERRMLVEHYQYVSDYSKAAGDTGGPQADLFGSTDNAMETSMIEFPKTPVATAHEKLLWEKETLGMYVSSHPLAGLRKYISQKAKLIGELTAKEVNKRITVAGMVESVKKIRTKKGDTMAIIMIEDPSGKMEATLFPKMYTEAAPVLEQPDTVLKIEGVLDLRMGQLQMRVDKISRSSLTTMIKNAKEAKLFDEEEARRGISITRRTLEEEVIEAVDEEGNVIAGEIIKTEAPVEMGEHPITDEASSGSSESSLSGARLDRAELGRVAPSGAKSDESSRSSTSPVHLLTLPARAPKQLLLDIKNILIASPGSEAVALSIGGQQVTLPITATLTPEILAKLEDIIRSHSASA